MSLNLHFSGPAAGACKQFKYSAEYVKIDLTFDGQLCHEGLG